MNMNSAHKNIRSVKWTPLLKAAHKGRGKKWVVPKENAAAVYNFWNFFVNNYKDIELIIRSVANKYAALINPDDMHEELIISLQRNDVLSQYNSSKAQLNTFLTMKVQGYAKHLLTKRLKEPGTVDIETLNPSKNDFQEYGTDGNIPLTQLKTLITPSTEEDLIVKEVFSSIKKKLDTVQQEVLERKCMGYSNKEIAQDLNCTISKVSKCMDLVRNISKELL
jgi:RNA polymerase sigma factor (sigma-70 family)